MGMKEAWLQWSISFSIRNIVFFSRQYLGCDLVDMQLITKYNKGISYLLCVIDIVSKYAWATLLKDKIGVSISDAFQKILNNSRRKPNKIWVHQGSQFYNTHFKKMIERQ